MIKISLADDIIKNKYSIENDAYVVLDNDDMICGCEFNMNPPSVTLCRIYGDDLTLLDGVIRQTLSYSLDHECPNAEFDGEIRKLLFKLNIIKKNNQQTLDILEFFTNLNCVEKF